MEVDRLEVAVQAEAQKATAQLDKLISKLNSVSSALSATNTSGLRNLASGVKQLSSAMQTMNNVKTTDFNRLAKGIERLGSVDQSALYRAGNSVRSFANSMNNIGSISDDAVKLSEIAKNISKFGNASVTKAIANLPVLAAELKSFITTLSTAPNVSQNLIRMTNAMAALASNGAKFGSTINGMSRASKTLANQLNSTTSATNSYSKSNAAAKLSTSSLTASIGKLVAAYYSIKRVIDYISGSIVSSMNFTETVNLFQTSFKKIGMEAAVDSGLDWGSEAANAYAKTFITEAQSFTDKLVSALSLDPNTVMNYQAVFAQMANAFGLVDESVINLSESFTMLGLDIASLWNMDVEDAMTKLKAGLAGETEPLRSIGVDITEATLKMTAMKYGIDDSVASMSYAAKTQLRWLAIMDQTEVAFGDMAKTIDSPANQLRVLSQQWENLSRSIGNVFLPVITTVLPYINAVVIALRNMIDTLATALGYELPDYSDSNIYTDVTTDIDGLTDATDNATKANEAYKKSLAGFDELNILSENKSSSSSTNTGGSGYDDLDDAINERTTSYLSLFNEQLANMNNQAQELAKEIQPKLEAFVEFMGKIEPILIGIATAFVTYKVITWFQDLASAIAKFSLTPAGVIAIAIGALAALVTAVKGYYADLVDKDLSKRFGDVILSQDDIDELVNKFTETDTTAKITLYVTAKAKLNDIESDIEKDIATLNKLNWKISVGLGLTAEESETYKKTIEKFVSDTELYIEQQQYVANLAIDAVIQGDSNFNAEMTALVNEYFNDSKGEMERLGKELRAEMDNALADGIIDTTEQKTINNLIKEINEITSQISDAEFKAKLQMITVDGDISADSFKDLTKQVQDAIDEKLTKENESYYTALTYINVAYQAKMDEAKNSKEKAKLQKEWDADIKKLSKEFSQTKATITLEGMQFSLDTLKSNYADALDAVRPDLSKTTSDVFSEEILDNIINMGSDPTQAPFAMQELALGLYESYASAMANSGLSSISRKGLQEMLDALEPTMEQYQKIYEDSLAAGSEIPAGVSDALTDAQILGALAGNIDSIWFLVGQKMSTDENFLNLLATSKDAGKQLNGDFIKGLKSKIPDLKLAGNDLVFDLDKAIKTASTDSGKNNMPSYAKKITNGYKGVFDDDTTVVKAVKTWLQNINDTISNWKIPQVSIPLPSLSEFDIVIRNAASASSINYGVKQYASGGIPDYGQLFIANEAGPELIGSLGGHSSVVANNSQIEAGIEEAAYRGYMRAIMESGGGSSGSDNIIVENIWKTSNENLFRSTQRGQQKSNRRYQVVTNPV